MNNLSDMFRELSEHDQRAFASGPRDASAISKARRARHRTRVAQATGGTLALGGLAVGGAQLLPGADQAEIAAASPSALSTNVPAPATNVPAPDTTITWDEENWSSADSLTLQLLGDTLACGMPAPTPTDGRTAVAIDNTSIRSDAVVIDLEAPEAAATYQSTTELAADVSVRATGNETLYADIPASVVALAKDGEIVALLGSHEIDPTKAPREIPTPEKYQEEYGSHPTFETEAGVTPVLGEEAATFSAGYALWDCGSDGFANFPGYGPELVYPPLGDTLEAGEYEAYVIARVIVDDQSAAEHVLRDKGFDLWGWDYEEQAQQLGLSFTDGPFDEEDGISFLQIDVPVPASHLSGTDSDEIVVSEPVTIAIP